MRAVAKFVAGLALVFAVSCAAPSRTPADVERGVRDAMTVLQVADERLDAEGVIALLAPDFMTYQDGVRAEREDVVEVIRTTLPALQSFETAFEDIEVIVISPDAALVSMTFLDRIVDGDGQVSNMRGASTFLWREHGGDWLIAYLDADHYSVP